MRINAIPNYLSPGEYINVITVVSRPSSDENHFILPDSDRIAMPSRSSFFRKSSSSTISSCFSSCLISFFVGTWRGSIILLSFVGNFKGI